MILHTDIKTVELNAQHWLIYRLVEVKDEAKEERVVSFKLKADRSQPTHKMNQLHHRILEP